MNITVKAKIKGVYNNIPYHKVIFAYDSVKEDSYGEFPYEIKVVRNGAVVSSYKISISKDVFDELSVGETLDSSQLCFNSYGKIVGIGL